MRLIDADEVLSKIDKHHRSEPTEPYRLNDYDKGVNWGLDIAIEAVLEVPTVAGTEMSLPKRGRWIEKKDFIYCSECGDGFDAIYKIDYRFCPNCGARMEEDEDVDPRRNHKGGYIRHRDEEGDKDGTN